MDKEQLDALIAKFGTENEAKIKTLLSEFGTEFHGKLMTEIETKIGAELDKIAEKLNPSTDGPKEVMGFKGIADFAAAVQKGNDERLKTLTTDIQGEYIIPVDFSNEIFKVALENANFLSRTRQFVVKGNSLRIPYRVDKNHAKSSLLGGVALYWVDGGTAPTASDLKFGRAQLNLHKLMGLIPAESEFIEDSPFGVATMVRDVFGEALGYYIDDALINGDGVGKPKGILNAECKLTVAKETNQVAATIVAANLFKMLAKLPNSSKRRAVWIYGADVLPQLQQMTIGDFPVFLPMNNVTGRPFDTILGMPAIECEHTQALGTEGDLYLVDWSEYITIVKGRGMQFDSSMHLYFDTDKQAFRVIFRIDGQCWWETYQTLANSTTKSPVVTLATRS